MRYTVVTPPTGYHSRWPKLRGPRRPFSIFRQEPLLIVTKGADQRVAVMNDSIPRYVESPHTHSPEPSVQTYRSLDWVDWIDWVDWGNA
jgi:hypothetical protein